MKQLTHQPITLDDMLKLLKQETRWGKRRNIIWGTTQDSPSRRGKSLESALLNWKDAIEWRDKNKPHLKAKLESMYGILERKKLSTETLDKSAPE